MRRMKYIAVLSFFVVLFPNEFSDGEILKQHRRTKQVHCENLGELSPPANSTCWQWTPVENNNIATSTPLKGCDYTPCEQAVCACDPYCCITSWDLSCRGYNMENGLNFPKDNPYTPGCSASILCCEEESVSSDGFIGPGVCSYDKGTRGYTDIRDLNEDMMYQYLTYKEKSNENHVYVLCPNTTFTLHNEEYSLFPVLDDVVIKCGKDGSRKNHCVISGGEHHIIFSSDSSVKNVTFYGIDFIESTAASVASWSPSPASATFFDCHWRNNRGYDVIDIWNEGELARRRLTSPNAPTSSRAEITTLRGSRHIAVTTYPSMNITFMKCKFTKNFVTSGVILSVGGVVQIVDSIFHSNFASGVTIGIAGGGALFVDPLSKFINNTNFFSTIFIDNKSSFDISKDAISERNRARNCTHVFLEKDGSSCLYGGICNGVCCRFDNETCLVS